LTPPADTPAAAAEAAVIRFDDNRLLALLLGEHDRNLARIEKSLGVSLSCRGNRIAITGASPGAEIARDALHALYARLERGLTIDAGEVDAAVRLAADAAATGASGADAAGPTIRTPRRHISARSAGQRRYMQALAEEQMVFGLGPAGTGKTYLAVAQAVQMLMAGSVDRIILSRPAVEAGERLGFLPGDLREKIDPYLAPLYDALHDMLPGDQVTNRLNSGEIEVAPLAFMRGRTLAHAFVILDEAQNATRMQMKMYLTRMGEGSRMVVTGDPSQVDLPPGAVSGLAHAVRTLQGVEGVHVVRFDDADVVRHPLVTRIVRAYDAEERKRREARESGEPDSEA
jgi:phosphate starvation-inducible PhoH-like protein